MLIRRSITWLAICSLVIHVQLAQAKNILTISETTETVNQYYYNNPGTYMYLLERYLSPKHIVCPQFNVTQVNWSDAKEYLDNCNNFDAIILWEAPCYINDERDDDPYHRNVDVIPECTANTLVQYVKNGGALLVAGGVTNYGNGHPNIGAAVSHTAPGKRSYIGYSRSPLAEILPVVIEKDAVTITALDSRSFDIQNVSIFKNIDLNQWPLIAYHRTTPRLGAENLALTEEGHPLISRWEVEQGRVVAVTAAPRAALLVTDQDSAPNPVWSPESLLWDRLLRWALDIPSLSQEDEAMLIKQYENAIAPPDPLPSELRLGEFPYLAHILDAAIPNNLRSLNYKYFNDLNFNAVVMQGFHSIGDQDYQHTAEELKRWSANHHEALTSHNLSMILRPGIAESVQSKTPDPTMWAQKVLPSGKLAIHYDGYKPCPYNKSVIQSAKEQIEMFMPIFAPFERFKGIVPDDEWAWVLGYRNPYQGGQGIGSYSPWVNEHFKAITGYDAPEPVYREKGYVAPEDDLWLKWCQLIRQDAYYEYNEMVTQTARHYRPDFLVSNYPGGFEGNTGLMIEEIYLDCWRQSPLLALERVDVRSNFREDALRNEIPLWAMIGIFRMPEDKSMYPETLRLTVGVTLGSGAKGIILWNSVNLWGQYFQHPGRDWLEVEAQSLGEYLQKFGSMFLELDKEPADMWILSGWFWINSFDNYLHVPPEDTDSYNTETPWWHFQIADIVAPATMRAGIYPEFVTEKQLLSADLFDQKAVMLPGAVYSRQAVIDNLEKYIRKGGYVYLDKSSKISIEGAKVLPIDFSQWHRDVSAGKRPTTHPTEENYQKQRAMSEHYIRQATNVLKQHIAPQLEPKVLIDSTDAAYTMLANGKAKYLSIYNTNENQASNFTVQCRNLPSYIYDIEDSTIAASGYKPAAFDVSLPAGGWKVYALTPYRTGHVSIQKAEINNGQLYLNATLYAECRALFEAAVPVKITLEGNNGKTYTLYRSTDNGNLDITIPFGYSVPAPVRVTVKEMFEGHKSSSAIGQQRKAVNVQ